ncbi:MAG: CPBP family intramembrane glutamic endopeptidase [Thermoanaerobaculia bacterium]
MVSLESCRSSGDGVASPLHTVVLVVGLLAVALVASLDRPLEQWPRALSEPGARALLYARVAALQALWTAYVMWGVRRSGGSIRSLVYGARWTAARWLRHSLLGLGGVLVWLAVQGVLSRLLTPRPGVLRGIAAMLPHSPFERVLWVAFVLCVAICEEVVYRGYLIRQLHALTGRRLPALLLQASVYGLGHLGLSLEMAVSVALLGVLLGALVLWQESLVPAMVFHAGTGLMAILASSGPA